MRSASRGGLLAALALGAGLSSTYSYRSAPYALDYGSFIALPRPTRGVISKRRKTGSGRKRRNMLHVSRRVRRKHRLARKAA